MSTTGKASWPLLWVMKKQRENKKIKTLLTTNGLFQLGIIPATILKNKTDWCIIPSKPIRVLPQNNSIIIQFNVYFIHYIDYGRFTNGLRNIVYGIKYYAPDLCHGTDLYVQKIMMAFSLITFCNRASESIDD